jgi:hypothetical protein
MRRSLAFLLLVLIGVACNATIAVLVGKLASPPPISVDNPGTQAEFSRNNVALFFAELRRHQAEPGRHVVTPSKPARPKPSSGAA